MNLLARAARRLTRVVLRKGHPTRFDSSKSYWEERYERGADSGWGSYGHLADFKARVINDLVRRHRVQSIIEWGCGDGAQLGAIEIPSYVGVDVSETTVKRCREMYAGDRDKRFLTNKQVESEGGISADMALSLDVIYHLVEEAVFEEYMHDLFASARDVVVIYSSNRNADYSGGHVRHRRFTDWINTNLGGDWAMSRKIPNEFPFDPDRPRETSFADFYVFVPSPSID